MPGWTWAVSLGVHAVVVLAVVWLAYRTIHDRAVDVSEVPISAAVSLIPIELPAVAEGTLLADQIPEPEGSPAHPAGGATIARVDTGRDGRGGDRTGQKAIHLSDSDDGMVLSPDLVSHLDKSQVQRLHTSVTRQTREDRRATTQPTELTLLASGEGDRPERRAPSPLDPSRGAVRSGAPEIPGGILGVRPPLDPPSDPDAFEGARRGASRLGGRANLPGLGVDDGRPGRDHRASADVMHARPDVTLGPVTIPAVARGRAHDTVDSEQEVATVVRSLVHASTSGGLAGAGAGGSGGGGAPGAGGSDGAGSHPLPLGRGDGDWFDLNTQDPRVLPYFRRIHAKIEPLWQDAFPRSAMLELKQGTVILEFTVMADGRVKVSWPPLRPSGIDEFDRNCASALRRAAPFDPIPPELGRASIRIRAPFTAQNPIVK